MPNSDQPSPLSSEDRLRSLGVDHDCNISAGTDTNPPVARSRPIHRRPYLPTAKAGGFTGALR
jgi:hypothetical protein